MTKHENMDKKTNIIPINSINLASKKSNTFGEIFEIIKLPNPISNLYHLLLIVKINFYV